MATISSSIPISSQAVQTTVAPMGNFVDRLAEPIPDKSSGPISAFFQAIFSLGLLPLLLWPLRWMEFLDEEREVMREHIEWWRRRVDQKDVRKLDKIAVRLQRRPILMVLPWLAVGLNVLVMGTMVFQGTTASQIWDQTFGHRHHGNDIIFTEKSDWQIQNFGFVPLGRTDPYSEVENFVTVPTFNLYNIWLISLFVAYCVHGHSVRSHVSHVSALVAWTNKLAQRHTFPQIEMSQRGIGLNFFWIAIGVVCAGMSAWWSIPMLYFGAMQRNYTRRVSPFVRNALATQTRAVFAITRTGPDRTCLSTHCGAVLPAAANYCPRCGSHA